MEAGSIRLREARAVVLDLLKKSAIPAHCYTMGQKELTVLIGPHAVVVPITRNLTFYGLAAVLREVEGIARDFELAKSHRGQIDLEEAIAAKST